MFGFHLTNGITYQGHRQDLADHRGQGIRLHLDDLVIHRDHDLQGVLDHPWLHDLDVKRM